MDKLENYGWKEEDYDSKKDTGKRGYARFSCDIGNKFHIISAFKEIKEYGKPFADYLAMKDIKINSRVFNLKNGNQFSMDDFTKLIAKLSFDDKVVKTFCDETANKTFLAYCSPEQLLAAMTHLEASDPKDYANPNGIKCKKCGNFYDFDKHETSIGCKNCGNG